jgi:hypothetical protein
MSENINVEKLATVLNRTSQQGNANFVKMLWGNQPADIQTQLIPLLDPETRQVIDASSD